MRGQEHLFSRPHQKMPCRTRDPRLPQHLGRGGRRIPLPNQGSARQAESLHLRGAAAEQNWKRNELRPDLPQSGTAVPKLLHQGLCVQGHR